MPHTTSAPDAPLTAVPRRIPTQALVAAWSIPVLVLGQFALLAVVPVIVVLVGSLRNVGLRPLRWWTGLLAALSAAPMAIWLLRPDGAPSLSKDMKPAFAALIAAAAAVLIVKIHLARRH